MSAKQTFKGKKAVVKSKNGNSVSKYPAFVLNLTKKKITHPTHMNRLLM